MQLTVRRIGSSWPWTLRKGMKRNTTILWQEGYHPNPSQLPSMCRESSVTSSLPPSRSSVSRDWGCSAARQLAVQTRPNLDLLAARMHAPKILNER